MNPVCCGSRCCVCRSSPAQLPLPRLCRGEVQHPRRRARNTQVGLFPASGQCAGAADLPPCGNPFPRRSARPQGCLDAVLWPRSNSGPRPGCFELLQAGSPPPGDVVLPSSSCPPGGLLPTSAVEQLCASATVDCLAMRRCQRGRSPPLWPFV